MAISEALQLEAARPAVRSRFSSRGPELGTSLPNFNKIGQCVVNRWINQIFSQFFQGRPQ